VNRARIRSPGELVQAGHPGDAELAEQEGRLDLWLVYVQDADGRFALAGEFIGIEAVAVRQALKVTGATRAVAVGRGRPMSDGTLGLADEKPSHRVNGRGHDTEEEPLDAR
jgi:hypothetical protein